MRRVLIGVVAVVVLAVGGLLAAASMQPDTTHVERSLAIAATPADVFPLVNDLKAFNTWDPWSRTDPDQQMSYADQTAGTGAWYEWKGEVTGAGKMTITESVDDAKVVTKLDFTEPFASTALATTTIVAEGEGSKVTWAFESENDLMAKAMGLFMDMDAMLGPDFEKGLANLKPLAEQAATARADAERLAAEEAARLAEAEAAGTEAEMAGE